MIVATQGIFEIREMKLTPLLQGGLSTLSKDRDRWAILNYVFALRKKKIEKKNRRLTVMRIRMTLTMTIIIQSEKRDEASHYLCA